jgi:hypothetical protein
MKPVNKYKYVREKNREAFAMKYSLRRDERIALIEDAGLHGLVLFEFYLRLASIEDIEISDQAAADYFGWNLHTARRYRRLLVKKDWIHTEKAKLSNGHKIVLYYLGKEEVNKAKQRNPNEEPNKSF